jgi:hypothetical protein
MTDETDVVADLSVAYRDVVTALAGIEEEEAWLLTRCVGWSIRDLVFHLRFDAIRGLTALAMPSMERPDTDFVSYWGAFQPGADIGQVERRMTRIGADVFSRFATMLEMFQESATATANAAAKAGLDEPIKTQGHVLRTRDLLVTLIVEAGVHHLDLVGSLERPGPSATTLGYVRETLDGLLGHAPPIDWDDVTYTLVGTGRVALTPDQRAALGTDADRFPLFG